MALRAGQQLAVGNATARKNKRGQGMKGSLGSAGFDWWKFLFWWCWW